MKVALIEGIGFGEQSNFQNELSLFSIEAKAHDLDQPLTSEFKSLIESSGLVVFRSRWSASVEEGVFIKTLLKRHQVYFEYISEMVKQKKVKVVAIGRGALLWLEWLKNTKSLESELRWVPENYVGNSWIDTKIYTKSKTTVSIRALVSGRAYLSPPNWGGNQVKPWIDFEDKTLGWVVNENLYLSLVDVFSLSERAQLPDFGYEDLSMISTRSSLIQMVMSGQM